MAGTALAFQASFVPLEDEDRDRSSASSPGLAERSQDVASYHTVGRTLIGDAARYGRSEVARAAVEVFRRGLLTWPDAPPLQNDLGAALVELAQVEAHRPAVAALTEAIHCFRSASHGVRESRTSKDAAISRFELNELMALSQRAGRTGDDAEIADVTRRLNELLPSVSASLRPYALELLGQAHMLRDDPAAAADAFQAAVKLVSIRDAEGQGRCLANLAAALARQGQPDLALAHLQRALGHQPRDIFPLAWGRTQNQIAHILLDRAVAQGSAGDLAPFKRALEAAEAALATHQHVMSSRSGLSIGMGAANVFLSYGTRLVLGGADPRAGERQIRRAFGLYLELFPHLSPPDVRIGVNNLQVALELLAGVSGNAEREAIAAITARADYALEQEKYSSIQSDLGLIINSTISGKIPPQMGKNEKRLVEDIRSLLQASGMPESEWPRLLDRVPPQSTSGAAGARTNISASMPEAAQELFGDAPPAKGSRTRARREFPDEWFANKEIVAAARRRAVEYKNRDKTVQLDDETIERARAATSFIRAYERRRRRIRDAEP